MFKLFKAKSQRNPDSRDYQLFIVFAVGTAAHIMLPINGFIRCGITIAWAGILVDAAIKDRVRHQWQWRGATKTNVLKSTCGALLGCCFYISFVIQSVNRMAVRVTEWSPNTLLEYFTQTTRLFSQLLVSTDPIVSFLLLPVGWGIFMALVNLKIAYLYNENFLNDCQEKKHDEQKNPSSVSPASVNRIMAARFFRTRPFVLSKRGNLVRISFYKISPQDIHQNIVTVAFSCFIFLFSIVGAVNMVRFGLLESLQDDSIVPEARPVIIAASIFPCFILIVMALLFWMLFIRHFFAIRVIEFRDKKLIIRESTLGFSRRLLQVHIKDLRSLVEKRRNTKIPEVRNTALLISQSGKQIEIASHLLPEAMNIVQSTYDKYRESDFHQFYDETQPILIK